MSRQPISGKVRTVHEPLLPYLRKMGVREAPALARLREETHRLPMGTMQIVPEQGALMQLLAQLMGAKRYLEIGTFTGYSALAVALALPPRGRVVALDVSAEWTGMAKRHWEAAGVLGKIDLRLAPAAETLAALLTSGKGGTFDLAFIDADKENYDLYYEKALALLRPGGLIAIDNVLWGGAVADSSRRDAETVAIRRLNARIREDGRVSLAMLPIGDGVTLAWKRPEQR